MRHLSSRVVICATLAVSLASAVRGEGAVDILDCRIVTECDASGTCTSVSRSINFTRTPVDVQPHGEGDYRIAYGGMDFAMTQQTPFGPWVWSEGRNDWQTLLFSSANGLIWVTQDFDGPTSTTRFLICEVG